MASTTLHIRLPKTATDQPLTFTVFMTFDLPPHTAPEVEVTQYTPLGASGVLLTNPVFTNNPLQEPPAPDLSQGAAASPVILAVHREQGDLSEG